MARYVIKNEESIAIKKSLKKWGEVPVKNDYMDGVVRIENYRKYQFVHEVDVTFVGKIYVKVYREPRNWYDSSILTTHNISKIKLNRFLRRNMLFDIQTRMNYFGAEIRDYYNITKIKWK